MSFSCSEKFGRNEFRAPIFWLCVPLRPLRLCGESSSSCSSFPDDGEEIGDLRAVVFVRAGALLNLIIGNTDDGEIAVHVIGLCQGVIAQFVTGEGLQTVLGSGDELDPWPGLPQEHPWSSLVGEPDEEETQVAAVVDGHAAGVLDFQ